MTDPHRLHVIVGSTRPDRAADHLVPWVLRRTTDHGRFDVELIDLRDWPLPMFQETIATVGDVNDPTYSEPIVRDWNRKMAEAAAYLFITPEYNHSVPGVLKNAIDNVFVSFALRNKPAAFVGYSGGPIAAARAVEHLAHIAIEAEMAPLRNTVLVGGVQQAFDDHDAPINPLTDAAMSITLDDLAWWADALTPARAAGELPPGTFRMRAAMAAAAD
jgi:NAD(P)H-dependent FMN reductase